MKFFRYTFKLYYCILAILLLFIPKLAFAIDPNQQRIFNLGIEYFDICTSDGSSSSSGSSSSVVAGDNKDYAGRAVLTDDQLKKIAENKPFYEKASQETGIPWQMLAAIHVRESGLRRSVSINADGPYQILGAHTPHPSGDESDEGFQASTTEAAKFLLGKNDGKPPASEDEVKRTFFRYNGTASVYITQGNNLGLNGAIGEGSPYVMNKADAVRDPDNPASAGKWGQIKGDHGSIEYPANKDYGAYVIYKALGGQAGGGASSLSDSTTSSSTSGKFIWVGDSRTEGMHSAVGNNADDIWIHQVSAGYDWFDSTAAGQATNELNSNEGANVVFLFGVNDLGNIDKYKTKLSSLMSGDWSKASKIIIDSVNPVFDGKSANVKNDQIDNFNQSLKSLAGDKFTYVDTNSDLNDIKTDGSKTDGMGVHYFEDSYKKIYNKIRSGASSSSSSSTNSSSSSSGDSCGGSSNNNNSGSSDLSNLSGTDNEKILTVAKEFGTWGSSSPQACYIYGGGHGKDQAWWDKAIENHFNDSYGVDCSGFISAVIYKATGYLEAGAGGTSAMCTSSIFQEVPIAEAKPGDISIDCPSHVEIITQVNPDGTFETVGSHTTGCGNGFGSSPGKFKGAKVLRYVGKK